VVIEGDASDITDTEEETGATSCDVDMRAADRIATSCTPQPTQDTAAEISKPINSPGPRPWYDV